jgi:hypothetical protein
MDGTRDHLFSKTEPRMARALSGRSSATGLPSRVTVSRSPASTRLITSPPWLRRSRIEISGTGRVYHA